MGAIIEELKSIYLQSCKKYIVMSSNTTMNPFYYEWSTPNRRALSDLNKCFFCTGISLQVNMCS